MKKIIEQIIKFGIVGVIAFIIDFVITMTSYALLKKYLTIQISSMVAALLGFTISVIVNYLLSMKYVFVRRAGLSKKKEFMIFVILSVFGLLINEFVIWLATSVIYVNSHWLSTNISDNLFMAGTKLLATFIVMVYNFITRKIFLEK